VGLAYCKVTTQFSKRHQESFCITVSHIRFGDGKLKQRPLLFWWGLCYCFSVWGKTETQCRFTETACSTWHCWLL